MATTYDDPIYDTTGTGATVRTQAPAPTPATPDDKPVAAAPAIATAVPDEFKGSNYGDVINWLDRQLATRQPLTDEQLAKVRRRQKAEGVISGISDAVQAVANLVSTHNYAPNMYDPTAGMSAKTKARFDKAKAERDADDKDYYNWMLTRSKLQDADKGQKFNIWQMEQKMAQQAQAREDAKAAAAAAAEWKQKEWDRQQQWHDDEQKRWEQQFNFNSEQKRKELALSWARVHSDQKENKFTYSLGSGHGYATIPADRLNHETVSAIYGTLPADVRTAKGKPIYQEKYNAMGQKVKEIVGYEQPERDAMLTVIGAWLNDSSADATAQEKTRNAIRELAGMATRQDDQDNTPPSRR